MHSDIDLHLTPAELAAMREMGYSVNDIKKLIKDRENWHIPKKESFDEVVIKEKDDVEQELNFD